MKDYSKGVDIEDLPTEVQDVLQKYQYDEEDYDSFSIFSIVSNSLGYTFDFGLDAIPTNFRKMKKGGQVGEIKDAIDMLKIVYDEMDILESLTLQTLFHVKSVEPRQLTSITLRQEAWEEQRELMRLKI